MSADRLVTSKEMAAFLGVSVRWVRAHQAELGVRRVGRQLRFSLFEADQRLRRQGKIAKPDPMSPGQSRALHGKAGDLDKLLDRPKRESKRLALEAASAHFGVDLTSATQLDSGQATWILDYLEDELAEAQAAVV